MGCCGCHANELFEEFGERAAGFKVTSFEVRYDENGEEDGTQDTNIITHKEGRFRQ
jgi:hypothetical protein